MTKITLPAFALLLILGCSGETTDPGAAAPAVAAGPSESIYAAAVAADTRLASDYARDAGRQPAAVLAFFGIKPGAVDPLFPKIISCPFKNADNSPGLSQITPPALKELRTGSASTTVRSPHPAHLA